MRDYVKNRIVMKNVFFVFDWGISELACWVAPKHCSEVSIL